MNNPFEHLDQVMPEAHNTTPPSTPLVPSDAPSVPMQAPPNPAPEIHHRSSGKKWIGLTIAIILIGAIAGGGYFAYAQGFVSVPFLPGVPNKTISKLVASSQQVKKAQYNFSLSAKTNPRKANVKAFSPNTNARGGASDIIGLYGGDAALAKDMDVSGNLIFYYEYDRPVIESNGFIKVSGKTSGEKSDELSIELRKIGGDIYGSILKMPAADGLLASINDIVGQWIHLADKATIEKAISSQELQQSTLQDQTEELERIMNIASRTKFLSKVKKLGTENIAGVVTDHISLQFDGKNIESFMQGLIDDFKKHNEPTDGPEQMLAEIRRSGTADVTSLIEASSFEFWIEQATGMMRQVTMSMVLDAENNKQVDVTATMTLEKLNEAVTIERPASTIEFEDFLKGQLTKTPTASTNSNGNTNSSTNSNTGFLTMIEKDRIFACYLSKHHEAISKVPSSILSSYEGYVTTVQDSTLCQGITDSQLTQTQTNLVVDKDGDGLNKVIEDIYGSSDEKIDTDGDTYSDAKEIENGYNPNGTGELSNPLSLN